MPISRATEPPHQGSRRPPHRLISRRMTHPAMHETGQGWSARQYCPGDPLQTPRLPAKGQSFQQHLAGTKSLSPMIAFLAGEPQLADSSQREQSTTKRDKDFQYITNKQTHKNTKNPHQSQNHDTCEQKLTKRVRVCVVVGELDARAIFSGEHRSARYSKTRTRTYTLQTLRVTLTPSSFR